MTRSEIRTAVNNRTRETGINTIINDMINNTLQEIQSPGWAFSAQQRRTHQHYWNFNKRKATLATVANQEDYELPRDVDKIYLIRQITSPTVLRFIEDRDFYLQIPYPTASGNPFWYRIFEETGVAVVLSTDDKVTIVSSSTSDTTQTISVVGYASADGIKDSETISLNGTTTVNGTKTWKAGKALRISKSAKTVGTVSIKEFTTPYTTILTLGPEDKSAYFRIVSFYPIPSAVITMYLEYFTRIRIMANDSDTPDIPEEWHWVIEQGAVAKVLAYRENEAGTIVAQKLYAEGVLAMIESDKQQPDLIKYMGSNKADSRTVVDFGKNTTYDRSAYGIRI